MHDDASHVAAHSRQRHAQLTDDRSAALNLAEQREYAAKLKLCFLVGDERFQNAGCLFEQAPGLDPIRLVLVLVQ
jgi:hypothetical protein